MIPLIIVGGAIIGAFLFGKSTEEKTEENEIIADDNEPKKPTGEPNADNRDDHGEFRELD